ncbi:MAG: ABC transporter ATP-binding protein [Candidatus Acidiferrales bacterium]
MRGFNSYTHRGRDAHDRHARGKKSKSSGSFLTLLPEVWEFVRPQRWLLLVGFFLMAINRLAGFVLPASMQPLADKVIHNGQRNLLVPIVIAILAATTIQGITSYALTQLLSKAAQRMIADLRKQVQAHIGRLAVAFHDANKSGSLLTRIMTDVDGLRNLMGTGLVDFAGSLMTAVIAFILLMRISVVLTSVVLVILLATGLSLNVAIGWIRPIYRARSKIFAEVTGRLAESLGGIRVVKGYRAEAREEEVFAGGVQRLLQNVLDTLTATSLMSLASTMLLGTVSALIIYLGVRQVPTGVSALATGQISFGMFLKFVGYMAMLVSPIFQVVSIGPQFSDGMAGLERTREILKENLEDADPQRTVAIGTIRGNVAFDNVNFAYEKGRMVLHDVSFESKPGTATALVGPSGSGKSTIIGLVAAFYTPNSGRVLVDGVDLATVRLETFRTQLGIVLQDTFLFDGTIRENVAFSRPGASEEDILAACRIARVDEFAEGFEEKYETVIGERGVRLSGGQKQRISIARAILADPRILILDEATSSLDSESEALIQEGLSYLMRGRTTFVIAHRLSTIRRSEQILVVEAGKIVERGTHTSLYARGGRYYDLYTKQHGIESNLFLAPGEGDAPSGDTESAAATNGEGNGSADTESGLAQAARLLRGRES